MAIDPLVAGVTAEIEAIVEEAMVIGVEEAMVIGVEEEAMVIGVEEEAMVIGEEEGMVIGVATVGGLVTVAYLKAYLTTKGSVANSASKVSPRLNLPPSCSDQ
jgi:short-subunit dehydrogenase